MKPYIEDRCQRIAQYIIDNHCTIRAAAPRFNISKSNVYVDLSTRLPKINRTLYLDVRRVLDKNRAERHLRGGEATRRKYNR